MSSWFTVSCAVRENLTLHAGKNLMDNETSSRYIVLFMLLLIPFLVIGLRIKVYNIIDNKKALLDIFMHLKKKVCLWYKREGSTLCILQRVLFWILSLGEAINDNYLKCPMCAQKLFGATPLFCRNTTPFKSRKPPSCYCQLAKLPPLPSR